MQYTTNDLKPVLMFLKKQGHGSKKKFAKHLNISPQQLSFYLRFKTMKEEMFEVMLEFCNKPLKQTSKRK